jgi:drug/metabolite transporter (DMT)-like permease
MSTSSPAAAVPPTDFLAGVGFLLLGTTCFGALDGLSKLLAADLPLAEVLWARFFFFLVPLVAIAGPSGWATLIRSERPLLQLARGAMPLLAGCFIVPGSLLLPLADVTAILFAAPLLVAVLAIPLLGERVGPAGWIALLAGLLGVLFIVRPGVSALAVAALLPLVAAAIVAVFQVVTRMLKAANPFSTLFYTGVAGTGLTTPFLPFFWEPPSPAGWLLLLATGVLHGGGHLCFILAFARAPASALAPFNYFQIFAAMAFGFLVLGEVPDMLTLAGTAIIVAAGVAVLRTAPASGSG